MVMLTVPRFGIRPRELPVSEMSIALRQRHALHHYSEWTRRAIRVLCLGLLPLTLMATLLGSSTAMADDAPGGSDRGWIVRLWETSGPGVKAAAEVALTGTDADVQRFAAQLEETKFRDDRVEAAQIASVGGRRVQEAVNTALSGDAAEVAVFVRDGWRAPHEQDQRVRVAQIIDGAGRRVQAAGNAALSGTPADVLAFLSQGQYTARDQDERVQLVQILDTAGPAVQAAGNLALNGSADDVREFLQVGLYVARAHDQEYTSVAQLAEQARVAGDQAAAETVAAKDASARAVTASKLAKDAARLAASEAKAAGSDANKAASAAGRAASAASQAATAAQQAIDAARAANSSARVAANAAAQAASAAAGAAQAASKARSAAADAAVDATKAQAAHTAADTARAAASAATTGAKAADKAKEAATQAGDAALAAVGAGVDAAAAADAADEASGYANQSDAQTAKAKAAAAAARRHAGEAKRAAYAAVSLARKSAVAAGEAGDAARSAAAHALAAATAADEAGARAHDAVTAANESTKHAGEATTAANDASAAVAKAQSIYALAREVDAEELLGRTNAGIEQAQDQKEAAAKAQADQVRTVQQNKDRIAQAQQLAAEATAPGADPQVVAAKGRKAALLAMQTAGPWAVAAAETALSGSDDDVMEYLRTGGGGAAQQDDRTSVATLAGQSPVASVRAAAEEALKGDAATITAFLTTGQYQVAVRDFRVYIAQVASTGGRRVQDAGNAALDSGSVEQYRQFITDGQYTARAQDERVLAAQLIDSGSPEVKSAATIALEGPPELLHDFLQDGRYKAQRQDMLATTHVAMVQQLIAEASRIAATAQQNAAEARKAAALARKAAAEATTAANQAKASAKDAENFAAQAKASAKDAEASAARAAESAKTARQAAANAETSAAKATNSATEAAISSAMAHASAAGAWNAANEARASALAAGKDAAGAAQAAKDALATATVKLKADEEAAAKFEREDPGAIARRQYRCETPLGCRLADPHFCQQNDGVCQVINYGPVILDAAKKLVAVEEMVISLSPNGAVMLCVAQATMGTPDDHDWCDLLHPDQFTGERLHLLTAMIKVLRRVPCTKCFLAGTKVLMGDNSTKNIEDVRDGDTVLATDPVTGTTAARKVTRQIVTDDDKQFNELTLATRNGPKRLTATADHPFWSPSEHRWLKTSELTPGTTLLSSDKSTVPVQANRAFALQARTYNLTVDNLHTYYVLAGDTPVLVHNSGPCPGLSGSWHEGTFESAEDSFAYHFEKHAEPLHISTAKYLQDAKDWAARLAQPGGKAGLNAKRMPFDDGKFGVKYSDPNGGMGGIIGPDGRVVSFWYTDDH
ncbi:polymorphic toxin-type HINT domain-containing protein [Streptomyces sp. RKAG293]|uniref:polymorphic toxin-type HINT domain-containing protein n=1 Tax=Streptomyces sp. RKAG293 TaxID=2893403 RepID=UPI002033B0AE|nr:polymorphic toxin-type HINT domain-containing protein [Streptomyces sp. RKAG293]MCM2423911.1 hypothetical protein [Streptomyces sp. RKAG293]